MQDVILKIFPIFLTFFLGYLLKRSGFFREEDGGLLLKLVFFVGAPALTFISISNLEFSKSLLAFPILATLMIFSTYLISSLVITKTNIPRQTEAFSL